MSSFLSVSSENILDISPNPDVSDRDAVSPVRTFSSSPTFPFDDIFCLLECSELYAVYNSQQAQNMNENPK